MAGAQPTGQDRSKARGCACDEGALLVARHRDRVAASAHQAQGEEHLTGRISLLTMGLDQPCSSALSAFFLQSRCSPIELPPLRSRSSAAHKSSHTVRLSCH